MMPIEALMMQPTAKLRSRNNRGRMKAFGTVAMCTADSQPNSSIAAPSRRTSNRVQPIHLLAAIKHQLERGEEAEITTKPNMSNRVEVFSRCSAMNSTMPVTARMPIGRFIRNTQRQFSLSVKQPPSVGPIIGPNIAPCPRSPWLGRGVRRLISSSIAWLSGISAAPKAPCTMRRPRASAGSRRAASQRGQREAGHGQHHNQLAPKAPRQPRADRCRDGPGDDIGGQHPRDLLLRGRHSRLDMRQRDIGDGAVHRHHRGCQHRRGCDEEPSQAGEIAGVWRGAVGQGASPAAGGLPVPRGDGLGVIVAAAEEVALVARVHLDLGGKPGVQAAAGIASTSISTGRRCTTFTQLPVAFWAGSGEKASPEPGLKLATWPVSFTSG